MIKINPIFSKCIDNIDYGREVLQSMNISDFYKPDINFEQVDSMYVHIPNIIPQIYIAAFDLDWTLSAQEKSFLPSSANSEDIVILPQRKEVLEALMKSGYTLVVFTNQLAKSPKVIQKKLDRITKFCLELGLPVYVIISTHDDEYRKPNIGMWKYLTKIIPDIRHAFYVGDAAGRTKDFADSDKLFAENIGITFHTPEEIFPCDYIDFNKFPKESLVVMVGAPGSGKSRVAAMLDTYGYTIISRDALNGDKKLYKKTIINILKSADKTIVCDSTNPTLEDRIFYYDLAKTYGLTPITIYFLSDSQGYNSTRDVKIPKIAYHIYYSRLDIPTSDNTPGILLKVTNPCVIEA